MLISIGIITSGICVYCVFWILRPRSGHSKVKKRTKPFKISKDRVSLFESILLSIVLGVCGLAVGWIFYKSFLMMGVFSVVLQLGRKSYYKNKRLRKNEQNLDEFMEINRMLIAELYSGKSLEQAYQAILVNLNKDSNCQYPLMRKTLTVWCEQFDIGWSVEEVLRAFAKESGNQVIDQFVVMISATKKHGGNLLEVIDLTNRVLRDKRQMQRDIEVIISEKRLEQKLLSLMPFGMLLLMQLTAYEFIAPLYESVSGRLMMTATLLLFIGCYIWSDRMTRIEA
ncbi:MULTISPECIES: type II secretion system F family protein [unclassified Fusibacter]|uniref:type II secretion system F family protein n=1 Tax=unclassified Fusibacter TaxID=2624464 RepID=UPI00101349A8|nr:MULTISPECIES: type II secretion system F family protein [unclassified Fusibacter]MCK8060820.1 type II secretion system F family protein [Fusibacter sp. A2]NPE23116.1 hypothetical protein [Fusibacter sp. A1]RXV59788.1 hypothetical protein DWB64_14890 [Fusibacter sp. A1]